MSLANIFLAPIPNATILYASLLSIAGSFFIAYFSLRKQGVGAEAIFLSLSSVVSGIWLYELVYHYAFGPEPLSIFMREVERVDFSGSSYQGHSIFPLIWSLVMISLPFAGLKWMGRNRYFSITLVAGLGCFVFWILLGFPQFFAPNWCSSWNGCKDTISYPSADRVLVGYLANSFSKLLVLTPSALFVPVQVQGRIISRPPVLTSIPQTNAHRGAPCFTARETCFGQAPRRRNGN